MLLPYDPSLAQNQHPTAAQAPSISHPDPEPSATKSEGRARNHLNPAGQSILDEYWAKFAGPVIPSIDVRNALVAQIKNCGNDWYGRDHITSWFRRHVASHSIQNFPSAGYVYPSLTKPILDHLEVLIRSTSNPSSDVIKTWATLLSSSGAQYEDVVNWVRSRLNQPPTTRLLTPANTATPEPSLPPSSPKLDENHNNANMNPNIKYSPIASPNLLPNAYPSISRVPGHGPGTQVSPVSSPTQVDFKSAHYRQRSTSSDVSSMPLASPPFPPSPIPPSSGTQVNDNYTHHHQRSASSNISSAPLASPPFNPSPTPASSATYPNDRYRPFQQWSPSPSVNSTPQFPSASLATPSCPSTSVRNEPNSHTNGSVPPPPPARTANSHPPPAACPSPARPPSISPEEIKLKQQEHRRKPRNPVLQAIIEGFAEAPANPTALPAVVPTSSAEYKAMFASYEKQINHVMQVLEK